MTTALEQQREDQALGAAWRRCEAVLPEGWHLRTQSGTFASESNVCTVEAWSAMADDVEQEFGQTMTAALEALADALEARRAAE